MAPSGSANYLVPGLLAVALVGALLWWSKSRNQSAAEPSNPTPSADRPSGSGSGSAPPSNDRGSRDRGGNDRGANGGRDNAGQRAQHGEPQRREGVEQEVAPQRAPQNVAVTPTHPRPTSPDPRGGRFTIADATSGMPAGTTLVAEIETSMGTFTCNLLPDRAPISVANFVGLARGHRDFWDPVAGRWTRRAYFDGTVFHRVIPDFMIQGGDILRSGQGGPGYEIPDENTSTHDRAGLLCMANHGPGTNGSQFFITERATPHLNNSYSVLGECTPTDLIGRIARVPAAGSTPITPVYIQHVRIRR